MNFKLYYSNLTLWGKIQLYLLPILLTILIHLNLDQDVFFDTTNSEISNQIKFYKQKITDFKQTNTKITQINVLKIFEVLGKKFDVNIVSYKFESKNIKVEFTSKYKNGIIFLNSLETIGKIKDLQIEYKDHLVDVKATLHIITNRYIDIENITFDKTIANCFIVNKTGNPHTISSKAIIGNYLILNDKWYTVGDKYKKSTIVKIQKNYIELLYNNKITKMEIFNQNELK